MAIQNPIPHIFFSLLWIVVLTEWDGNGVLLMTSFQKKHMAGQKGEAVCSETVHSSLDWWLRDGEDEMIGHIWWKWIECEVVRHFENLNTPVQWIRKIMY